MNALILLAAVTVMSADVSVDEFLDDFAKHRENVEGFEARFTQETKTPDEDIESAGTIVYRKPRRIVYRYDDTGEVYLIDRDRAYEYQPKLEQIESYDLKDRPEAEALFLGFTENPARLKEAYHVAQTEPENAPVDTTALDIRPKDAEEGKTYFQRLRLCLRTEDYIPVQLDIVNDSDSRVIIHFTDIRVNPPIDESKLQIAVPEKTKVILNGTPGETVGPEGKRFPDETDTQDETRPAPVAMEDIPNP